MIRRQTFPLAGLALLFAGCGTQPAAPPARPPGPPSPDYHLIMGELALARGENAVAMHEYLAAAQVLEDPAVARRATLVALHAGDYAAARASADRWEQLSPGDLEAAQYQAVLHARAGDSGEALRYLLRVADGNAGEAVGANLQLITTLLAAEPNIWRAAGLMADVAAAHPGHSEGWYGAALLALAADRPTQAADFANRALALDPNLLDAMFLRARAQLFARPEQDVAKLLAPLAGFRHAPDPGLRYRFAGLLVLAGRDAEADALYEDILVNAPDQHDARMARALLALDAGRLETAETELHGLLQRHGRVQDALYYLGVLAEKRGALEEALDWYARVSPEVERWLDAQLGIADVLIRLEGPDAGQAFFDELRRQWPEQHALLAFNEAALLTASGHPGRSLELLEKIDAAASVEQAELDWQLALATAAAGDVARAEALFRDLIQRDPGNPSLLNALGFLLAERTDRLEEAETLLQAAHAAAPANPAVLDSLGWLRARQGDMAAARPLLEESWQRQPSPETGRHLLETLHALGDQDAMLALRKAMEDRFPGALDDTTEEDRETS